jgi:hypothetical protein
MVGGHFDVESAPGKGTTISAHIRPGNGSVGKESLMKFAETKP